MLDFLSVPHVISRVLICGRGTQSKSERSTVAEEEWETCNLVDFEDAGSGQQAKACRWPLEAGKGKKKIFLRSSEEGRSPVTPWF